MELTQCGNSVCPLVLDYWRKRRPKLFLSSVETSNALLNGALIDAQRVKVEAGTLYAYAKVCEMLPPPRLVELPSHHRKSRGYKLSLVGGLLT